MSMKLFDRLLDLLGFKSELALSYIKNTSLVTIASLIGSFFSYIVMIFLSRYLGAKGLGQYSFLFAYVGLFMVFFDLGLNGVFVKELSKDFKKVDKYISNIFSFKLINSLIMLLIFFISLLFIKEKELFIPLLVVFLSQVIISTSSLFDSILRIKHKGKQIAIIDLATRIFYFIGSIIVLYTTKSLLYFILFFFVYSIFVFAIKYIISKDYFRLGLALDWKFLWGLLKRGFPFLLMGIFITVYVKIDSVMLSFMKNNTIVGYYNAGYKLINFLGVIPTMLLVFGFPLFSKLMETDRGKLKKLLEHLLFYSISLIIPIIIGVFYLSRRIIKFIYGFSSIEATISFKILVVAELFIFMASILGELIAADKQKIFAYIGGIGAVVNLILNFLLIPKYSLYGAGVATLITYFIMFILMYIYINKNLFRFNLLKLFIIPIISSFVMWLLLINLLHYNMFVIISLCAIVYFIVFFSITLLVQKFSHGFKKD